METGGSGTAQLPLARPAPPLSEFDPEGDVTPTGADSFWTWLDAVARTPWVTKGPYARWADKVQYKCSTAELSAFVTRAAPQHLEAAEGRPYYWCVCCSTHVCELSLATVHTCVW